MNAFKKILSTTSVVAILATMAAMPVSATGSFDYDLSYETLTQAIETRDGDIIPAGSIAVTLSLEENAGFDADTITFDIGENNSVLTDNAGNPIVTKEYLLEDALAAAASYDSTVCVAVAMSDHCTEHGEMFTFYLEGGMGASGADVEITNVNEETVQISGSGSLNGGETVGVNTFTLYENGHWYLCYYTGDATNDNEVNASDAAKINIMCNSVPGHEMSVSDPNFSTYFPNAPFHGQPDANQSGWINSTDATLILEYSAIVNASPLGEAAYSGCVHQVVKGMQIS